MRANMEKTERGVQFFYNKEDSDVANNIEKIFALVSERRGFLREDIGCFGVPKNWSEEQAKEMFRLYDINIELVSSEKEEATPLSRLKIGRGKYKDNTWGQAPLEYLNWLVEKKDPSDVRFEEMARAEIKRRKFFKPSVSELIVSFGKYKGSKWGDLPVSYLEWITLNMDKNSESYKNAFSLLSGKYAEEEVVYV